MPPQTTSSSCMVECGQLPVCLGAAVLSISPPGNGGVRRLLLLPERRQVRRVFADLQQQTFCLFVFLEAQASGLPLQISERFMSPQCASLACVELCCS